MRSKRLTAVLLTAMTVMAAPLSAAAETTAAREIGPGITTEAQASAAGETCVDAPAEENVLVESVTPIGAGKHLRLRLERFGELYDCVFFSQTEAELGVRPGQRADIVFMPQINEFRSRRSVQLVITDLRPHRG